MSKNDKLCHLVPQTLSFFDLTMSFFDFAIAERQSCDLRCMVKIPVHRAGTSISKLRYSSTRSNYFTCGVSLPELTKE